MNKERIEVIAIEVAEEMPQGFLWNEGCGYESGVIKSEVREFAARFLSRIDAERGKEAVAWMCWLDDDSEMPMHRACLTTFEPIQYVRRRPLFLAPQPAIPEGYALVPVEPTDAMVEASGAECLPGKSAYRVCADMWGAMLAAAKEPRHD